MSESRDEFYVGYLAMPRGHLKFVRIAVPVLLWLMVFAGAGLALLQRSPGAASWEAGLPVERTGVLYESPYPHIFADGQAVFLVEQGKRGAQARAHGLNGRLVTVRGWRLTRDGRELLELVPESDAIQSRAGESAPREIGDLGSVSLSGEIIDYKCYLGAMKPGDGKAHKACAILCLTGGIPAMLVSYNPGEVRYTVLANGEGGPLTRDFIELAGEPVDIAGDLAQMGPVRVLRVRSVTRR